MGTMDRGPVLEAYFRAMRVTLRRDWLRGSLPSDVHERLPVIETELGLVEAVRSDWHGMHDDDARELWRHLVAERVLRDPTVGELMTLSEVRALGYAVPRHGKVYDVDRFHEVFPGYAAADEAADRGARRSDSAELGPTAAGS